MTPWHTACVDLTKCSGLKCGKQWSNMVKFGRQQAHMSQSATGCCLIPGDEIAAENGQVQK